MTATATPPPTTVDDQPGVGGPRHPSWCDADRCQGDDEHVSAQFVLDGQVPLVVEVFQRSCDPAPLMSLFELDDEGYLTMPLPQSGPLAAVLRHIALRAEAGAPLEPPATSRDDPDRRPGVRRGALLRQRHPASPVAEILVDAGHCQVQTHPVHGIAIWGRLVCIEEDGETLWVPAPSS
jgi:hypothetical protein